MNLNLMTIRSLDPLGPILRYSLISGAILTLLGAVIQTVVYLRGNSDLLVAPFLVCASLVMIYLLRSSTATQTHKARSFAFTMAAVSIVVAPAGHEAVFIGAMFSVLASVVWMFTQPSRSVILFWIGSSLTAGLSHQLLAVQPPLDLGKHAMALLISGGLALLIYLYAVSITYQKDLLKYALNSSRQGVALRLTEGIHLLHLDEQAQQILNEPEPQMGFMAFVGNLTDKQDQEFLLTHCAGIDPNQFGEWERTFCYKGDQYIHIKRFARGDSCVWLITDETQAQQSRRVLERSEQALAEKVAENESLLKAEQIELQRERLASQFDQGYKWELDIESQQLIGDQTLTRWMGLPESDSNTYPAASLIDMVPSDWQGWLINEMQSSVGKALADPDFTLVTQHPLIRRDVNRVIWIKVVGKVVDIDGSKRLIGSTFDVTDLVEAQKAAEIALENSAQALDQLNAVAEAGGIGLFTHFVKSDIYNCSDAFREIFDLPQESFPQVTLADTASRCDPESRALYEQDLQQAHSERKPTDRELRLVMSDGTRKIVRLNVYPQYKGGKLYAMTGSVYDITEKQQLIDEKSSALALAENHAAQLVEQRDRQAQMYAVIGHELRTPTATLKMLLEDAEHSSGQVDASLFATTVDQLLGVIDTLRSVAQPERMQASAAESVLLPDLISSQLRIVEPLAQRQGIELQSDLRQLSSESINIRAQLLRQLISNLIKNAIVHSGGSLVRVGAASEVDGTKKRIKIWVEDNGRGISPDQQSRLFSAYERGNTEAEGTGLGLFISREIAQAVGGDLRYEQADNGGARFVLSFTAELASATEPQPELSNRLSGMRVLVAEDNLTIQMLTKRMLEKSGATVTVASNGEEALELFKEASFDLILSDIFMPKMNGYELVKQLRGLGCHSPVMGLSAATIGEETDLMIAAGADMVLSKPLNLKRLQSYLADQTEAD